ncbi:MBL fold metallo-hydrolase [Paenibacillus psychroresistens]|uniref:MBL fold metallo-hydrolase n=1 Tax=Paenibacillus psychroresistens TaxID=1778678 RepID=A0A6B8RQC3_9BACL|nr:MBL fold metallo-hydrolase [Paenibacillus psychroresistens]QGQ98581.1 MBL fold metallo-hydrolase [Paenibacillus psychroresistens]
MPKKRFENLDNVAMNNTLARLRQWRKERNAKKKDLTYSIPKVAQVTMDAALNQNSITWIGHATFLLRYGGLTIVTDPVWAKSMGFQKRLAEPGISIDLMPPVDVVLISHGHYDHLNFPSLRALKGDPLILVPKGLKSKFLRKGFRKVEEMSWWESKTISGVQFDFVPTQHWTRRTPWDTNSSHWGGWVLQEEKRTTDNAPSIYFAGDSGYFRGFEEIGKRYKLDYVLMPIGAYEPEWFMSNQHVTPEQAIQAYIDAGGKHFIPMHYGAFFLADDTPKEALDRLNAEWQRLKLDTAALNILIHGETLPVT